MNTRPRPVWELGCELGEGPVWVDGALWFTDIKGHVVHRFDPNASERRSWSAPEAVGFVLPIEDGGFVAGLKSGLHHFDPPSAGFERLVEVEDAALGNRLNDGAVDPTGHLWFGSMHDAEGEASGALYRLDDDGRCRARDGGYVVTNGPAFSPDGRTLYHTDTLKQSIFAFDVSPDGAVGNKRVFVEIERKGAYPDGPVVDAEGCVWTGLFGGWGVERYSPKGKLLQRVEFPCSRVTKIAFGGDALTTIYATTAWLHMSEAERAREPLAGALFAFETDVPGLRSNKIRHGVR